MKRRIYIHQITEGELTFFFLKASFVGWLGRSTVSLLALTIGLILGARDRETAFYVFPICVLLAVGSVVCGALWYWEHGELEEFKSRFRVTDADAVELGASHLDSPEP